MLPGQFDMRVPPAPPDASFAPLVIDDDGGEARRFRATAAPVMPGVDLTGFAELRASGSAQFSAAAWGDVRARIGDLGADALYLVDLRQESHGFVNGVAVSWFAQNNWGAVGLDADEAALLESLRLKLLRRSGTARLGRSEAIKRGEAQVLVEWAVESVASEAQVAGLPEGGYVRLPVNDHTRPSDEVVDRFVRFIDGLRGAPHLHFHCRGGKGRTVTFMLLHDMLRNAARVPFASMIERHRRLGAYDPEKLPDPASAKAPYIAERRAFLERFHRYARETAGAARPSWSAWVTARGAEGRA